MYIIVFIIILGILIFTHELGHFIAAKSFGVQVDEFALGFPPRLFSKKFGETNYALNLIPIGGYVKILGEDGDEESRSTPLPGKSKRFSEVSRFRQAIILVSGILGNLVFAWLVISIGFLFGLPTAAEGPFAADITNETLVVTSVLPSSPAAKAGLMPGDKIVGLREQDKNLIRPNSDEAIELISGTPANVPLYITVERGNSSTTLEALTEEGIVAGKRGIGIAMDYAGILKLPPQKAIVAGAYTTGSMTAAVAVGIYQIISEAVQGKADLSSFTGPVGIARMVGDAERAGFVTLLILVVLISINLAVINILPLPALDGGRLLFVVIEAIRRKPISQKFSRVANQVGFVALILLMVVITYKDVLKLFK